MGQRVQCDCHPVAGSLCSEPELCLIFLALPSLQDHCAVLRAFKLSDLELSISRDDFSVPFDIREAGAPRSDLTDVRKEAELGLEWVYLSPQLTTSPSLLHLGNQAQIGRVLV